MKLYLVRHGETALNEKGCYYGKTDAVLSVRGIEQAKYLQHIFKEVSFDYVVASPLVRAYNTAQIIIEERKQQIFGDSRLMEQDFGIFEGKTYEELKDREEYQAWLDSGGTIAFPEGEEQKEFRSRCVRGMLCQVDRLCKENVESAAFVVHGGTIMAVLEQLAEDQKDFYYWQVENGGGYRMLVNEDEWKSGIHRFRKIQKLGGVIE